MAVTVPSFSEIEVILQIGISFGNVNQVLKCEGMEGRPSQIGVDHDSGCIDHSAQSKPDLKIHLLLEEGIKILERETAFIGLRDFFLMKEFLPKTPQALSNGPHHNRSRMDL
jgi:hypothetical protein